MGQTWGGRCQSYTGLSGLLLALGPIGSSPKRWGLVGGDRASGEGAYRGSLCRPLPTDQPKLSRQSQGAHPNTTPFSRSVIAKLDTQD